MKRLWTILFLCFLLTALFSCRENETSEVNKETPSPTTSTNLSVITSSVVTSALPTTATSETTPAVTTTEEVIYPDIVYDTAPITGEDGEPLKINWNPYLLSPVVPEALKPAFYQAITAILNHRSTVVLETKEELLALYENLFYEFPPTALAELSKNEDTLTLKFSYRYQREEHLEKIALFGDTVENMLFETLLFGDGEAEQAILLYHAISQGVDYFQVDYKPWQTNAYWALVEKTAICYSFSDAYNYLLRQVGIDAYLVKGYRTADRAPHGWSLVKIDGDYYHCDTTWESSMCDGAGLYYFGMSDAKRKRNVTLSDLLVGEGSLRLAEIPYAESDRFLGINGDKFRYPDWTVVRGENVILYRGKEYNFGLS